VSVISSSDPSGRHPAREFGFPIERIRLLVGLWQGAKPSRQVKQVSVEHVADLDRKIAMRDALQELADHCHGDHRPDCPALADLSGSSELAQPQAA